jgi:hypothetical protein
MKIIVWLVLATIALSACATQPPLRDQCRQPGGGDTLSVYCQ